MKKNLNKILLVILSFAMVISFTSCADPEKEATEAVDAGLKVLQTGDMDKSVKELKGIDNISNLMSSSSDKKEGLTDAQKKVIFKGVFSNLTYKIEKAEKKDDTTVNVTVSVQNTNMKTVLKNWYKDVYTIAFSNYEKSDKEISKLMIDSFGKQIKKVVKKKDYKKSKVVIEVLKTEDGWAMNPNEKALDGLTGGLFTASEQLS